jgi:hypothetical protein
MVVMKSKAIQAFRDNYTMKSSSRTAKGPAAFLVSKNAPGFCFVGLQRGTETSPEG